jgi:hypothetical protein
LGADRALAGRALLSNPEAAARASPSSASARSRAAATHAQMGDGARLEHDCLQEVRERRPDCPRGRGAEQPSRVAV